MRTYSSFLFLSLAAATSLGGCKWSEFDDLSSSTWVQSQTKPSNVDSADWGIAIIRGANPGGAGAGTGGSVGTLGRTKTTYSVINYSAQGGAAVDSGKVIKLNDAVGIAQLPESPLIVADPNGSSVALVAPSGNNTTIVASTDPANDTFGAAILGQPSAPTGLTYVRPVAGETAIVVSTAQSLYGYEPKVGPTPKACLLGFDIASIGTLPETGGVDSIVVWGTDGKLSVYPGTVGYADCAAPATATSFVDSTLKPATNARIIMEGSFAILMNPGPDGKIGVVDLTVPATPTVVVGTLPAVGLVSVAAATLGGKHYLAAGFPSKQVDGLTTGQVEIYEYAPTGITGVPTAILHDAQPDAEEAFGRAVGFVPYNGGLSLAVAASNELFMYFKTGLYDDLRTP
jgi:hypothetical protein